MEVINMNELDKCVLCPRNCGVNRNNGETGFCKASDKIKIARYSLHMWEEPCISGDVSSGTIFFSNCNLKCIFCQNYDISTNNYGKEINKPNYLTNEIQNNYPCLYHILDKIKVSKMKTILIINKIDLVQKEQLAKLIDLYKDEYNFEAVIPVSVIKEKNLDIIIEEIERNLKPGPAYYNIEEYTDQTLRQLAEETIREKALQLLQDEVPHGIYVEVEKDASEFVFDYLKADGVKAFYKPDQDMVYRYINLDERNVFVKNLVSEAPLQKIEGILVSTLEKILVDIYCDQDFSYLQGSEYERIAENAMTIFNINKTKLLRYAKRRGVKEELEKIYNEL